MEQRRHREGGMVRAFRPTGLLAAAHTLPPPSAAALLQCVSLRSPDPSQLQLRMLKPCHSCKRPRFSSCVRVWRLPLPPAAEASTPTSHEVDTGKAQLLLLLLVVGAADHPTWSPTHIHTAATAVLSMCCWCCHRRVPPTHTNTHTPPPQTTLVFSHKAPALCYVCPVLINASPAVAPDQA